MPNIFVLLNYNQVYNLVEKKVIYLDCQTSIEKKLCTYLTEYYVYINGVIIILS